MKTLAFLVFLISSLAFAPDLTIIRKSYPSASSSEEVTNQLFKELSSVTQADNQVLVAYKGAVLTLKAKYAKGIKDKKEYFKTGSELIEQAVEADPHNIEIRCIRLGVQENSPKVVKYKDHIKKDKQFIIANFKGISSEEVRAFVKNYVLQSPVFEDAEKQLF